MGLLNFKQTNQSKMNETKLKYSALLPRTITVSDWLLLQSPTECMKADIQTSGKKKDFSLRPPNYEDIYISF